MAGSGGELNNQNVIEGGTDGTRIGNEGDNLKVNITSVAGGNEPIIPADSINYFTDFLLNASSNDLTVDGSSTEVEFIAGPSGSEVWYVTEFAIFIQDGGSMDATDYGAIASGLTNGTLIQHSLDSTDYNIINMKENLTMAMAFSSQAFVGSANGFLNDANIFLGAFRVEPEITLNAADSDQIKVLVRDNLTSITLHKMAFRAWKVIP